MEVFTAATLFSKTMTEYDSVQQNWGNAMSIAAARRGAAEGTAAGNPGAPLVPWGGAWGDFLALPS